MQNQSENTSPFHISFLVRSLQEAISFYNQKLNFPIVRQYNKACHFDCFGNQLVVHEKSDYVASVFQTTVEDDEFVVPHFGVILSVEEYDQLADRLILEKFEFFGEPRSRFVGKEYEQKVMFLKDPSGNAFEFKCYKHFEPEAWA